MSVWENFYIRSLGMKAPTAPTAPSTLQSKALAKRFNEHHHWVALLTDYATRWIATAGRLACSLAVCDLRRIIRLAVSLDFLQEDMGEIVQVTCMIIIYIPCLMYMMSIYLIMYVPLWHYAPADWLRVAPVLSRLAVTASCKPCRAGNGGDPEPFSSWPYAFSDECLSI